MMMMMMIWPILKNFYYVYDDTDDDMDEEEVDMDEEDVDMDEEDDKIYWKVNI